MLVFNLISCKAFISYPFLSYMSAEEEMSALFSKCIISTPSLEERF